MKYLKKELTDDKLDFDISLGEDKITMLPSQYKKAVAIHGTDFFKYNYKVTKCGHDYLIMKR